MFRHGKWISLILPVLLLTGFFVSPATAETPQAESIPPEGEPAASRVAAGTNPRVLSSNSSGVTFEVGVPWNQLSLETVTEAGKEYTRVAMPGWSETAQAGAPGLPMLTGKIGAPFGADIQVQVIPGKAHTQKLPAPLLPVATQKVLSKLSPASNGSAALPTPYLVIEEDPAVYAKNAVFPGVLAKIASDDVLRQQRVVGIAAYPVQYQPESMELTVYESLRVEVSFAGVSTDLLQAPASNSTTYESLLKGELLNYTTARQWRQAAAAQPSLQLERGAVAASLPWAPPDPGWRVKVREDGIYKLTYAELNAAGLPVTILDPRTFRLYNLGSQVAIYVEGESDGKFDSADYILFYGQGIDSKYTADNVYWLTYGGAQGLRMGKRDATPGAASTPTSYLAQLHMEENHYYFTTAPGDDALERWFWNYVYASSGPSSWTHTFTLAAPDAAQVASLKVSLLGYLDLATNPDHHVQVSLNGTQVGEAWWDGVTWQNLVMTIPAGTLMTGNNTLQVTCPNDTGAGLDVVFIDWAELDFSNTFLAENNQLAFTYSTSGTWKYQVRRIQRRPIPGRIRCNRSGRACSAHRRQV